MELDLQIERYKIKSGGFAPDPWVLDFNILHRPGEGERYPLEIPTKTGEIIDWTEAERFKNWVAVTEAEDSKPWILKAEARPIKPEATGDLVNKSIKTIADVSGQLSSGGLPLQSWLISDIINVGADLLNLGQYLQEPFAKGQKVIEGNPEGVEKLELIAPRKIEPPKPKNIDRWETKTYTNASTG
ncbi:MAG: hypothetical protein ABEJ65_03120, partial [bacterium]